MMTQTEMLETIKRAAAKEWSNLYECEKFFGPTNHYTITANHTACVLSNLLDSVTGESWYYSSRDDDMKPE